MSNHPFEKTYHYFASHRGRMWLLLCIVVATLVMLVSRLDFKEQITDFLPVDDQYKQAMSIYQEVAAGDKIVIQFIEDGDVSTTSAPQQLIAAIEHFGKVLAEQDTERWVVDSWQPQVDAERILDVFHFVYAHLPYYLEPRDYSAFDSLLITQAEVDSSYVEKRLLWVRQRLSSSAGTFMQPMLAHDPLGLGNRVASSLREFQPEMNLLHIDGYLFTPDTLCCLVNVTSPFGSSESARNAALVKMLEEVGQQVEANDGVIVRATGSPVIAAGNSMQIRRDTLLSATLALLLILALLFYAFRSLKSLLYILVTIGFGFLFGLGILSLLRDSISLIVVGLTSIILGIAVNYPLHFLCHKQEGGDWRTLVSPLLIGNVTTVGAFLTLVPLKATATRDLGLFAALMLVGTILFTLIFLPHIVGKLKVRLADEVVAEDFSEREEKKRTHRYLVGSVILAMTAVFGWFSLDTRFDTDLNHINYMTDVQRADFVRLSEIQGHKEGSATVFMAAPDLSSLEDKTDILHHLIEEGKINSLKNPASLLPSTKLQRERLALWNSYWKRLAQEGRFDYTSFQKEAVRAGFTEDAFAPFAHLLSMTLADTCEVAGFEPLTSSILNGLVNGGSGKLVAQLSVPLEHVEEVERLTGGFDLPTLNKRVLNTLTADFNYIGIACSLIVFIFLWISFRRIELACLAFLPMIIGWLWILGIMQLLDIQFNIVNIILATFIFGQGDDYTIFVVEGLMRDYRQAVRTGKRVNSTLKSYRRSILLSAIIMFIGIGTLIFAKHPALHSLAQVTIIGMGVVVLMAWIMPPLLFDWLVDHDKSLQEYILKGE
ncbi:MAG: MMPL family transporter [Bacteroidales bacterium]|nr:MMPL family transporter [Bacteroidales bacterium]